VHVLTATSLRLDHELLGVAEALVEVELDPVGVDATERLLARLARRLEEGERAVAAARSLRPHIQLSSLLLDEPDRLGRSLHMHVSDGNTVGSDRRLIAPRTRPARQSSPQPGKPAQYGRGAGQAL